MGQIQVLKSFTCTSAISLQGIEGVRNLADDILGFGKTYEVHNKSLTACL